MADIDKTSQRANLPAFFALGALMLVWGNAFPFMDYLYHPAPGQPAMLPPLVQILLRQALACIVLLPLAIFRSRMNGWPSPMRVLRMAVLGTFGVLGYHIPLAYGMARGAPPAVAALVVISTPIFVSALGAIFLREQVRRAQWAGVLLSALGVLLVVMWGADARRTGPTWAAAWILFSPIFWSIYTVIARREVARVDALELAAWHTVLATLAAIPLTFAVHPDALDYVARLSSRGWISIVYLGIPSSAGGMLVWCWALKRLPAARVAACTYAIPAIAALSGWVFRDAAITYGVAGGGFLVLCGLVLVQRHRSGPPAGVEAARPAAPKADPMPEGQGGIVPGCGAPRTIPLMGVTLTI